MTRPAPDAVRPPGAAAQARHAETAGLVRAVIAEVLPGVPPAEVTDGKHLRDLGADSIDRVEIVLGLIRRLGLDEPMSSFADLPDIGALTAFLADRTAR